LKNPITKKGWWSGSRLGPEFKSQYHKKKYNNNNNNNNLLGRYYYYYITQYDCSEDEVNTDMDTMYNTICLMS
jgi:hypothetical protein